MNKRRSIETLDDRGVVRHVVSQILQKLAMMAAALALLAWGAVWLWRRVDTWLST